MQELPIHLINSLGVLTNFSIAKKISKSEITKESKKIKRIFKKINPDQFDKLLIDALIEKTKKSIANELPPGLIFPQKHSKKIELDKFYTELLSIAQALSNKFNEQNLTKHQMCFIINTLINLTELTENDFLESHRKFQKYKDGDFDEI